VPAVLAVVLLGLTPLYWSQAIEAEVYALHALMVAASIWLMVRMLERSEPLDDCSDHLLKKPVRIDWQRSIIALAFLTGLGLTNHLTTLFLLPPALLAVFLAFRSCVRQQTARSNLLLLLKAVAAFLLPLLLYAYLPLRWFALHEEAMGLSRFVQWVIGGRFQGALQLTAWLSDMTRYQVVGRLMLQNWGWINLLLIVIGLFYLIRLNWRAALVLFITWLGFTFYALNYYVPDLAVFIIPAHVVMAICWAAGAASLLAVSDWLVSRKNWLSLRIPLNNIILLLLLLPTLSRMSESWSEMAAKDNSQLLAWGEGVLAMPLDAGAAILADSEKIAPLYYLQQAESVRTDLEIMVLPDEAAYRSELDTRLNAGQTVYLARFLPGLEGIYHLRSVGPLIEVSQTPLVAIPDEVDELDLKVGPFQLVGIEVREVSPVDPAAADITLFWQTSAPLAETAYIYLRWAGEDYAGEPFVKSGQHPAGNTYPAVAWKRDEIVPDYHLLPHPLTDQEQELQLQVAVGPSFQPADDLTWKTVHKVSLPPTYEYQAEHLLRAQNGRVLLNGIQFPAEIRPQTPLPIVLTGYGSHAQDLQLSLRPTAQKLAVNDALPSPAPAGTVQDQFIYATQLDVELPNGRYYLISQDPDMESVCGWLAGNTSGCILGEVIVSGVALPDGAANYDDKIALLDVELPQRQLQPGGQLPLNLRWQSLSPMAEDYTLFVQVLDAQDRIVGQVDSWPLQGTFPTSQWDVGEIVEDSYLLQLDGDMPPGPYKLHIGWYLLSTLQRLAVVDNDGLSVDDKLVIGDLVVP
jgi:hypothetical protein